jgi:outer membrane protein assembly factor BamB
VRESGDVSNNPGERRKLTGLERVLCLNAATGKTVWEHSDQVAYKISYPSGPRATPTISGGKVYTLGAEGRLLCLDAADGKVLWSRELKQEYKIEAPQWGFCGAPLVDGQKLICLVGGEGSVAVAFDKDSGKELWRALSASEPGYCPPSIIESAGKRQLIIWTADQLNGLDPESGKVYWSQPLKPDYGMSIAIPRKHGDMLFASGIGSVGAAFRLNDKTPGAELAWRGTAKTAVYAANTTPFIDDEGIIYGADCSGGQFRAVKLQTGERLWETYAPTTNNRRGGHGTTFIVRNGDRYFLFSETGDLILAKLSAKGYDEISRFHVLDPTGECFGRDVVWSHPAFASKCCFARNDKELVCVSLEAR